MIYSSLNSEPPENNKINNNCSIKCPNTHETITLGFNTDLNGEKLTYLHLDLAGAQEIKRRLNGFIKIALKQRRLTSK
jgi:hypothetical protein